METIHLNRADRGRLAGVALTATLTALHVATAGTPAPGEQSSPPDKSQYHLFNPTPRDQMRGMSTDRPDQTESAYTVDAGHFQLELDLVSFTYDRQRVAAGVSSETEAWSIAPFNLKAGLLNNVDLQLMFDPYTTVRVKTRSPLGSAVNTASGAGDFTTRLKVNLWGNDGGKTAFALMPYVKWPLPESSLRNGEIEGGIIAPLAFELPAGWGGAVMTEFDFVHDGGNGNGYDTEFVNTLTVGRDLTEKLGFYVEFFSLVSTAPNSPWQGQADIGFTYAITDDLQLDTGCNFGVTRSAPDYNPFIGLSFRF